MPAPRKILLRNQIYFVSFRMEEGLPLIPNALINALIWSAIARAYRLYPQGIIAIKVQGNHIHLMLRCLDPLNFPLFVGFIKQETAHYINRLLKRRQKSVWADRYDSPILLTSDKVIDRLAYMFTNSVKDGLVTSIDEDPFISTLKLIDSNNPNPRKICFLFPRSSVVPLANPNAPHKEENHLLSILIDKHPNTFELPLEPFSFKETYEDLKYLSLPEIEDLIRQSVKRHEKEAIAERGNKKIIGVRKLLTQSMLKPHAPQKFSRRMVCMSSDIEKRKKFLQWVKTIKNKAKEVYEKWKAHDYSTPFPLGLFPPAHLPSGNILILKNPPF